MTVFPASRESNTGGKVLLTYVTDPEGSNFAFNGGFPTAQMMAIKYFYYTFEPAWNPNVEIGVEDREITSIPKAFALSQSYPNPSTTIAVDFPGIPGEKQHVEVTVYYIRGRHVKPLIDSDFETESHNIHWNGHNDKGESVSSGIYLYTLKTEKGTFTRKMTVLK
jgi:hypothetical protein